MQARENLSITAEPQRLQRRQACRVTLTLANRSPLSMLGVLLSTKGGFSTTVSPPRLHHDRLAPQEAWGMTVDITTRSEAGTIDLPVTVEWYGASGRRERIEEVITFHVTAEAAVPVGPFRAFVVAACDYEDPRLPGLQTSAAHAHALAELLAHEPARGYGQERVTLLSHSGTTAAELQARLADFGARTRPEETVLVYFAGHAGRIRGGEGSYLCLHDARVDELSATAIGMDSFARLLARIPAARVLTVLDIHHAGVPVRHKTLAGYLPWRPGLGSSDLARLSATAGHIVLAAEQAPQAAGQSAGREHGLFAGHLLQAFKGTRIKRRGVVCVGEILASIDKALRDQGAFLTPVLRSEGPEKDFPITVIPE